MNRTSIAAKLLLVMGLTTTVTVPAFAEEGEIPEESAEVITEETPEEESLQETEETPAEETDETVTEEGKASVPEETAVTEESSAEESEAPASEETAVIEETPEESNVFEVVSDVNPMYEGMVNTEQLEEAYAEAFEAGESNELLNAARTCSSVNEAAVWVRGQMKSRASVMTITLDVNKSGWANVSAAFNTIFHQILDGAFQHTGAGTEGDYLYWHYAGASAGGNYQNLTGYWRITMNLTVRFNTTLAQEKTVTSQVTSILNSLPIGKDSSDYDKAYYIHEWITRNVRYTDASDYASNMYWHTAYSAVVDRSTVCQGYSLLFYRMALSEGLECRIVAGDGSTSGSAPHGWNIVRVDGKWYNIDSTWDAGRSVSSWNYFLAPRYPFGNDHRPWSQYTAASFANSHAVSTTAYSKARLDTVKNFVKRLYTGCLGRSADTKGLLSWSGLLYNKKRSAAEVVSGFFFSKEYTNKNRSDRNYIADCYKVLMDRSYDTGGMNNWLSVLGDYMSRRYVLKGFVGSVEFHNICSRYGVNAGSISCTEGRDLNRGVTRFVIRLYREALGREPDIGGLNSWTKVLATKTMGAKQVASQGFFGSKEFENKHYSNSVFVDKLYRVFLDRSADASGKTDWLNRLARGTSRMDVVAGFAGSAEFAKLMRSYGL